MTTHSDPHTSTRGWRHALPQARARIAAFAVRTTLGPSGRFASLEQSFGVQPLRDYPFRVDR